MAKLGIYCIENWSGRMANRDSVRPMLEFLETSAVVRFIHRPVSTIDQLEHHLGDWAPRKQYPVAYLALHGSPNGVWVGSKELSLENLLRIDQGDGTEPVDLKGKTLFLSSCSTLAGKRAWLTKLAKETRLNTLCGYGRDVEWFESAAFDLLLLSALAFYGRPSDAVKYLRREHNHFARWMRFTSQPDWKPPARPRTTREQALASRVESASPLGST